MERTTSLIRALRGRAEVYRLTGLYGKSIQDFEDIISLSNEEKENSLFHAQLQARIDVANIIAREKSQYGKAEKIVASVLKQIPDREGHRIRANGFTCLGFIHMNQGNYKKAKEYYEKAIHIFKKIGDERNLSRVYGSLGIIFKDKGDLENALKFCKKDLAISKKLSNQLGISIAVNSIGLVYYEKGEYDTAIKYLKQHLDFSRKIDYKRGIAITCNNIGASYREKGDHDTALKYYEEALQSAEAYDLIKLISSVSNSMGLIYLDNEKFDLALKYIQKYLSISETIGFKMGIDIACGNIGILFFEKGDYKNALQYYERSLSISLEIGDKLGCGLGYLGVSRTKIEMDRFDTVLHYIKKAEKIFTDYDNKKKLSEIYSALSVYYTKKGKRKKGSEFGEKALALAKKTGAREMEILALRVIARSLFSANIKKAISHLNHAVAIAKSGRGKLYLAHSLKDLAEILTITGKNHKAEKYSREAEEIFKSKGVRVC
jgi:tetratricopeptide (TPR) repeat protein